MIVNARDNRNGEQAVNYACKQVERGLGEIVGGTAGHDKEQIIKTFKSAEGTRPFVIAKTLHVAASLPSHEKLSGREWEKSGFIVMKHMGLDYKKHPFTVIRHDNTDHQHAHIIATKIGLDGNHNLVRASYWKGREAAREIEREFDLFVATKKTKKELRLEPYEKQKQVSFKPQIYTAVEMALSQKPTTLDKLFSILKNEGIDAKIRTVDGKPRGLSFSIEVDGKKYNYAAGKVSRDFRITQLVTDIRENARQQKRGIDIELGR